MAVEMVSEWEQSCWRGLSVCHPAEWEVAYAAGADERPRIAFADRRYRRLDVFYQFLDYKPNLELMLDRYRRGKDEDVETAPLSDAPTGWRGLIRQEPEGTVVHAGTFFESEGCFVEAAVVWPESRDKALEREILAGIAPCEQDGEQRLWQAMGLSVRIDTNYDLRRHSARVGRIIWDFAADAKRGPFLTVRRLALPEHWLKVDLTDWLPSQVPGTYRETMRAARTVNGHRGAEVASFHRGGPAARLRRRKQLRLDVAWMCDFERRVYHLTYTEQSRNERPELPGRLDIRCCKPVHVPAPRGGRQ
ncbi:MAG: hypothetical protein ACOC9S_05120 [Planctomycetota bacterium]